jgi:hypothetical protein
VGGLNPAIQGLQNVVTLNPTLNQAGHQTGYCDSKAVYWDIGAFGDTGPANHDSGLRLSPQYSILTDAADYPGRNNLGTNPAFISQYCNGSRVPPEGGGIGFSVPPGIADAVIPNPLFGLMPTATPDEGNQWINMSYGPLSLVNSSITAGSGGYNVPLGNYAIAAGSPAINNATGSNAPNHDIFGTPRPQAGRFDIGAVEFVAVSVNRIAAFPAALVFGNAVGNTGGALQVLTVRNTGSTALTGIGVTFTGPFSRAATGGSCTTTLAAGSTCTINVTVAPTTAGGTSGTVVISAQDTVLETVPANVIGITAANGNHVVGVAAEGVASGY